MNNKVRIYQNLPAIITEELREAILNSEIEPGVRLKQEEIAGKFQTSLIPVREALRTLENEGLVTIIPNKGAIVRDLSSEEVREMFETRIILEQGALELSIPNLLDSDFHEANRIIELLDNATWGKELSGYNSELHNILYRRCNNRYLLNEVSYLHQHIERYLRYYLSDTFNNNLSQEYHRKIVQSAKERNIEKAKEKLKTHMQVAMNQLVTSLKNK